jgi:hypothetical protein
VDNLVISDNIKKGNDIWTATEDLKDLDFSFNLLLLYWFQDFDDTFLLICDVDSLEYFRVLSPSDFSYNLVIICVPASASIR